jgi:hypothetical protein
MLYKIFRLFRIEYFVFNIWNTFQFYIIFRTRCWRLGGEEETTVIFLWVIRNVIYVIQERKFERLNFTSNDKYLMCKKVGIVPIFVNNYISIAIESLCAECVI